MSIHTDRAFNIALQKGAVSAHTYETWQNLMALSKRELAEIAMHLAALSHDDGYDTAIESGTALGRLMEERDNLKRNGIL